MICCICGQVCHFEEKYNGAPHSVMLDYDTEQVQVRDIDIYHCNSCGHTQIPSHINESYYEEYSMGSFWGASFKSVREQQVERLSLLAPSNNKFLDIGCGVGHYLELAQKYFIEIQGVEPSSSSVLIAREKGFNVTHDFFHQGLSFDSGFDVITLIEVLEHLEDPLEMIKQAATHLKENGVMLVEVPNGQRIFEKKLYNNLCTDHIQYFSVTSLSAMACRAGLSVVCVQESADPNLLEIYMRKVPKSLVDFSTKRQKDIKRIVSQLSPNSKVAGWGAGAEATCFLAMLRNETQIQCLFDSDNAKHGHYLSRILIKKPTSEAVSEFNTIIIFANAHINQIQTQLKQLGFSGEIITFK
ncbi:class I SAM-dependent methyltransferase [Paenibacillus amylolyticus]|uniref:class I SAM-dependent methyltransferase n=1 Tax=Paenibacillus amylolyticus TaxID=1451 RepID=UPI003D955F9E